MPLPLSVVVPPTPSTVVREFSSGAPGQIPVASSVVARQPSINSVFSNTFGIGGYYTTNVVFTVPALIAGSGTTLTQTLTFSNSSTNNAGITAFPATVTLKTSQVAYVVVTGFCTSVFADTAIIISPVAIIPNPNSAWFYIGPKSIGLIGAKISINFFNAGGAGFAGAPITYTIQAVLFGGSVLPTPALKNPKTP